MSHGSSAGLRHIAAAEVASQPWRNGGGQTRELFTWPGGESPWQLRLSVADITRDGPFSAFDGVERWFAVLQGAGVHLAQPGLAEALLTVLSPPLCFDGATAPGCRLVDGPTRDLNLMLRRGAGQAVLQEALPGQPWVHPAPLRGLFTTAALHLQTADQAPQPVAAWCLVLANLDSSAAGQRWTIGALPPDERALWLAFSPATPTTPAR